MLKKQNDNASSCLGRLRVAALYALWIAVMSLLLMLVALPLGMRAQAILGCAILLLMLALRVGGYVWRCRVFFFLLAAFLLLRYIWWRTFYTLGYNGLPDFIFMLLLYLAELYGVLLTLLSFFINVQPLNRRAAPLDLNDPQLPQIDVLIPTYSEPVDLLEITMRAALDMRYPASHLKVYLLDDGGTLQKRRQTDPQQATQAQQRYQTLQALAARHGALYLTRERNQGAKAGNVNAALAHCHGDLVLILDADHVPTVDFLEKTVGFFQQDQKLYLVQTPHFFINADPVEKNLGMFGRIPQENEMFYAVIQRGLDFWDSAYFCGSAALLRRTFLDQVGGIGGVSITEDAETAMKLHACGYRSAYLNEPLISGLQPETFVSFIVQRLRWAQGMVQLFLLQNVWGMKGLNLAQKLCYFSNTVYWFFSYARVILLIAPMAYLLFGLRFYNADIPAFFAYGLMAMLASIISYDYLFGRYRWTLISELYEMLQALFSLQAIILVICHPHAPSFKVTPKGEQLQEDAISQLAAPFYVIYALLLLTLVVGLWKFWHASEYRDVIFSALLWNSLNLIIMNACIGVLYERRQRRLTSRVPVDMQATLLSGSDHSATAIPCRVTDISARGAQLAFDIMFAPQLQESAHHLQVFNRAFNQVSTLPIVLCNRMRSDDQKSLLVGVQFTDRSVAGLSQAVALAYGDSQRWTEYRARRNQRRGIVSAVLLLIRLGLLHVGAQCLWFFRKFVSYLKAHMFAPLLATCFLRFVPDRIRKFLC